MVRRRPEIAALAVAGAVFGAGALNLALRRGGGEATSPTAPLVTSSPDPRARVGPDPGEAVAAYIERKKQLLADRASGQPRRTVHAVLSLPAYRRGVEAEALAASLGLEVTAVQMRVPLPEQERVEARLSGSVSSTVGEIIRSRLLEAEEELATLEAILPDVTDEPSRVVYIEDIEAHRQLVGLLRSDPAVVFALVVRSTHDGLARAGANPEVRLIDLPEDPGATPSTHLFRGILPEETERAG